MKGAIEAFLFALTGVLALESTRAADWAHWRGPEQNGVSRERGLVDDWSLEPRKNVLWVSEIGGRSAPIVLNGRVYLNTRTANDVNDPVDRVHAREQVVCWDARTGGIVWRDAFNVFQTDVPAPRVGWAAMVGDPETGNVYVHSVSGLFRCYTGDGKLVWERSLFEEHGRISGYGGRTVTPIIDEDRVIVSGLTINWGNFKTPPPKHRFHAFDKRTGDLLWTSTPGGRPYDTTYSTPMVAVIGGARMLISGNADGGACAIHARTGEPLWTFRMSHRGLNASPVTDGRYVYIAHGEDNIDNNEFGRVQCVDPTGRGDITATHGVWRVDGIKAGSASPLVHDGILYVVTDTGELVAFDSGTGGKLWEYRIGTVGKGSPVWADGRLIVMEVNGNIHVLKPSRASCESVSHVALRAAKEQGTDEIYASPAIADGRIFLVTRDRTICVGRDGVEPVCDPVPAMAEERAAEETIARIQLVPYDSMLNAGSSVEYHLRAFDRNGRFLKRIAPTIEVESGLDDLQVAGNRLTAPTDAVERGGNVIARVGDLTAEARVRVFPPLPWSWNFNTYKERDVPPTWVSAFADFKPAAVGGDVALYNLGGQGKPSTYIWLGPDTMRHYTVKADVLLRENKRRLSSAGITVQRYNLILKGNTQKVGIQTWPAHVRIDRETRFRADPEVWYTLKLTVADAEGGCRVLGKVWKRDDKEPSDWTLDAFDPHPNRNGSPGLYIFGLAEVFFDNVQVFEDHE
ncbi:MAG: serine/threonine protein kinase [Planctomycetes bacterium]|nr:serine/threonine protein kinase [Planctomycetota bacterium]